MLPIDPYGNTALHYAAGDGKLKVVKYLMNTFYHYWNTEPRNFHQETPLHLATKVRLV